MPEILINVGGSVIRTDARVMNDSAILDKASLLAITDDVLAHFDAISAAVGDNWFPCGSAYLHVDGRSDLIKVIKKEGRKDGQFYRLGPLRASAVYRGGFDVHIDHPRRTATEGQSLNIEQPLVDLLSKHLVLYNVRTSVQTWID